MKNKHLSFEERFEIEKALVNKYNDKYNRKIDYKDVLKQIDKNLINSTKNFRYLTRIVQKALISTIENQD